MTRRATDNNAHTVTPRTDSNRASLWPSRRERTIDLTALVVVLALGAALRWVLFHWIPVLADGDSFQYYRPAHRLMDGIDFPLDLKRPPAYSWLLALIGTLSGPALEHVVAVQHTLGLATAGFAYGIGRLTFGRFAAVIAGLSAAFSGELLLWEHYIMTESLFTFLLSLATFLFLIGVRRGLWVAYVGCGMVIGLAALTRPHAQILLLIGPLTLAAYYRSARRIWRPMVLLTSAALVVIVPWLIRNHLTHGAFTIAGSLGHTLVYKTALLHTGQFVFINPSATDASSDTQLLRTNQLIQRVIDERLKGGGDDWAAITIHSTLRRTLGVSEAEGDALMRRAAIGAILGNPIAYVRVSAQTFAQVFAGVPEDLALHWQQSRPRDERSRLATLMARPSDEQQAHLATSRWLIDLYQSARFGALLPLLFVLGLMGSLVRPAWRPALFVGLAVLALHGVTAATAGANPRYHHPAVPLVHVVAAGGVLSVLQVIASWTTRLRRWRSNTAIPTRHLAS